MTKNTGVARLLRAIDMFMEKSDAGQVPTNTRGQIDYKNLTLKLRQLTSDDGDWQVRTDDRQNFYREELKSAIDIITSNCRIAERADLQIDDTAKSLIAATAKLAKADRDGAVEARAQYAAVFQKLIETEAKYAALRRENDGLKSQLEMIRSGLLPKVN